MTAIRARAVYIPSRPDPVFGQFHECVGGAASTAVLMVAPFGWDDSCSYRSRREWAHHLVTEGVPTLRIDLPGGGDSGGHPADADRLEAWTAGICSSARWLRQASGCGHVTVVGLALGGFLALHAMAQGAALDDLVLWGVPARGRALVRELRAFSALENSRLESAGAELPPPPPPGGVLAGGYLMTAETVADLESIDLTAYPSPPASTRVLMLGRDSLPVDERLLVHLKRSAQVTVAAGPGYGAMVTEPSLSTPPWEVFASVAAWLGPSSRGPKPAGAADGPVLQNAHENAPEHSEHQADAQNGDASVVELETEEAPIRESAMFLDHDGGRLFGVLAEPSATPAGLCVVWLSAGAQRRTGPNRMWVEAARRWAARGVPTLRLDLEGVGDAEGDVEWGADEGGFYLTRYAQQITTALDALQARGLPNRFVLGGLCSGAYWALHVAVADERVSAAVMLNPRTLNWDPWIRHVRDSRALRGLFTRSLWRKVLHGEISFTRPFAIARAIVQRALRAPVRAPRTLVARRRARRTGGDDLDRLLDGMRDAGKTGLIVFAGAEQLHAELRREGRLARWQRWPNLELEVLAEHGDLHTLRPLWLQARAHESIDRVISRDVARAEAAFSSAGRAGAVP